MKIILWLGSLRLAELYERIEGLGRLGTVASKSRFKIVWFTAHAVKLGVVHRDHFFCYLNFIDSSLVLEPRVRFKMIPVEFAVPLRYRALHTRESLMMIRGLT